MQNLGIPFTRYLPALSIISLLVTLSWWYKVANIEKSIISDTLSKLESQVGIELSDREKLINKFFRRAEHSIDAIASDLDRQNPNYEMLIPNMVETMAEQRSTAIGTHFAEAYDKTELEPHFSEYTYRGNNKVLYAPFFTKDGRNEKSYPYDYTLVGDGSPNIGWYNESINTGSWFGPYFGQANQSYLISYRAPFRWDKTKQSNLGNVVADYSLENLRDMLAGLQLLTSGYGILLTADGTIISHPVTEYLSRNIRDISSLNLDMAKINGLPQHNFISLALLNNEIETANDKLVYSRSFSDRGWTLLAVINKQDALEYYSTLDESKPSISFSSYMLRMEFVLILLCVSTLFLFCTWVYCKLNILTQQRDWLIAGTFSFLCIIAILLTWKTHLNTDRGRQSDDIVALEETELAAALNAIHRSRKSEQNTVPTQVKTGFYVQSVKFVSSTDVYVTGYAWQKLPKEWLAVLPQDKDSSALLDFVLPEAESSSVEVIYSDRSMTRWYFEASLRQEFNYLKYPFDEEEIWLRARFKDFHKADSILVPDLDSYPPFSSSSINGLENYLFIEGWDITKTSFYYRDVEFSSNFGEKNKLVPIKAQPELFFGITIKRDFVGVLIAHMLPLGVIAYLVFAVLMIHTRNKAQNELLGFNSAMVLGYAASLFFALTLSHFSLRQTLQAKGIIYLEYFYFSLYIALALVVANALAYTLKRDSHSITPQWAQFIYWPALLLSLLIFTVVRFS